MDESEHKQMRVSEPTINGSNSLREIQIQTAYDFLSAVDKGLPLFLTDFIFLLAIMSYLHNRVT